MPGATKGGDGSQTTALPTHAVRPLAQSEYAQAHDWFSVTHMPPQSDWPMGQAQLVPAQLVPPAHALLHAPQWLLLFVSAVSQPFDALPSQFPKPMAHAPSWQLPLVQLAPAFANEHPCPHEPQCESDDPVFVSQPFDALPSQLPKPAVHAPS